MNQKGFANIVLVLIIIAITGAAGYFILIRKQKPIIQQTTTPSLFATQTSTSGTSTTSEFSTATNSTKSPRATVSKTNWTHLINQNNYEIKYPRNYKSFSDYFGVDNPTESSMIQILDPKVPLVIDPSDKGTIINHQKMIRIEVEFGEERRNFPSLRQYVEANYRKNQDRGYTTSGIKNSNIGGREAYEFTINHGYTSEGHSFVVYPENKIIWVEHRDKLYRIIYPTGESIFEEIASTLQFTE